MIDGKLYKYNQTTFQFVSSEIIDNKYQVITRKKYPTTKDLLDQTGNYNETCYLSNGISRVKQLAPKRFNFIADASTTLDGFFAHEVSSAVPEAVDGEKDELYTEAYLGYKEGDEKIQTLDSAKLIPLLTAALKDVLTKVETLETKVAALEGS